MTVQNKNPIWESKEPLQRNISFERSAIDVEKRTVPLSFSSETTEVVRWGDVEILDHSPGACDLTQLRDIGVLLFNHNSDIPIGGIESAVINNSRGEAVVRFDTDAESDKYFQKVVSGTLKAVSVRYSVDQWEVVETGAMSSDGKFTGPCWIARKWKPTEISIVSIPADTTVGVGRSEDPEKNKRGSVNMEIEKTDPVVPVVPAVEVNQDEIRAAAIEGERVRTTEITAMCRKFNVDPDKFIADGKTVEQARAAVMDKVFEERQAKDTTTITADEADKFRAAVTDGLSLRSGLKIEKPADGATQMRGMKLLDLARECVERKTGKRASYADPMELARDAITGTSDFPNILANIANKSMSQAYQAAQTTYQYWTRKGSLSDFKTATRLRLSEADELVQLNELGQFKHAKITEGKQTVSLGTYGRRWSISRQAIINDDLGALSTIPQKYSMASKRMINCMVYAILTANAAMQEDSKALFHTDHKNLGTAAVISIASISEALAKMLRQTNIGGKEKLNIRPEFLLLPPEIAMVASQVINSTVDGTKSNEVINPIKNMFTIISDAELTDAKAWYLAANAGMVDTIEVNYLNGVETPVMESRVGFDVDGIEYRIRLDVGVTALDYRGLFKNAGD